MGVPETHAGVALARTTDDVERVEEVLSTTPKSYPSHKEFFEELLAPFESEVHYNVGRPESGLELRGKAQTLYWNLGFLTTHAHDKARQTPQGKSLTSLDMSRDWGWKTIAHEDLALEKELERALWNVEAYFDFDHYFDEDVAHWHVRGTGGWQVAPEVRSRLLECGYTVHKEDAWKLHLRDPHGALILYKHPDYTPVWQSGATECDDPERGRVWLSEQRASLERWEFARRALLTGEHFIKYDFDGNVIEHSKKAVG